MKMSEQHYRYILGQLEPLQGACVTRKEALGDNETRLIWDAFHAIRVYDTYSYQEFDYKDAHIETAMRKALKELHVL